MNDLQQILEKEFLMLQWLQEFMRWDDYHTQGKTARILAKIVDQPIETVMLWNKSVGGLIPGEKGYTPEQLTSIQRRLKEHYSLVDPKNDDLLEKATVKCVCCGTNLDAMKGTTPDGMATILVEPCDHCMAEAQEFAEGQGFADGYDEREFMESGD